MIIKCRSAMAVSCIPLPVDVSTRQI